MSSARGLKRPAAEQAMPESLDRQRKPFDQLASDCLEPPAIAASAAAPVTASAATVECLAAAAAAAAAASSPSANSCAGREEASQSASDGAQPEQLSQQASSCADGLPPLAQLQELLKTCAKGKDAPHITTLAAQAVQDVAGELPAAARLLRHHIAPFPADDWLHPDVLQQQLLVCLAQSSPHQACMLL